MPIHRNYLVLVVVLAIALFLKGLPIAYKEAIASNSKVGILTAGQWLFSRVIKYAESEEKNRFLVRQNVALALLNMQSLEARHENERLRQILAFNSGSKPLQLIAAEVVGRDPDPLYDTIQIDCGHNRDIKNGWPVVTVDGLVGHVAKVGDFDSEVRLIMDSRVSAVVQETRVHSVVSWVKGPLFRLSYVDANSTVRVGDRVITSGLGGRFPEAIVIGYVTAVLEPENQTLFKEVFIESEVDFWGIEEVFVIRPVGQ
tara:strand:- start:571 stop:1341 length:771 start_codon:yes stop_codon:yes gene_type:complete